MNAALDSLLEGLVDYAGLFPPAAVPMPEAVANYAAYRVGARRSALARFVLPAARLQEFTTAAQGAREARDRGPWPLAVLAGAADARALETFDDAHGTFARIDTIEARAEDARTIAALAAAFAARWPVYVEVPLREDPAPLVAGIAAAGLRAKIRTGGVTADAFPPPEAVLAFLVACTQHGVPFKATAGLHHPLRGEYPLTYASDSARGTMYGYLNVYLAALLLQAGHPASRVAPLLEERDASQIAVGPAGITWRGLSLSVAQIAEARARTVGAFGSCSFVEPTQELDALPLSSTAR